MRFTSRLVRNVMLQELIKLQVYNQQKSREGEKNFFVFLE